MASVDSENQQTFALLIDDATDGRTAKASMLPGRLIREDEFRVHPHH